MSVVDFFLNALIKHLQKKQKIRNQRKQKRKKLSKTFRRITRARSKKKLSKGALRKSSVPRKDKVKRPVPKILKKLRRTKKQPSIKKKERHARFKIGVKGRAILKAKPAKVKKTIVQASKNKPAPREICIGRITHFFPKIQVVVLKVTHGQLVIGDRIRIKGHGHDFTQNVKSLQIESVDVKAARKGQLVGLKVDKPAKAGDKVFK